MPLVRQQFGQAVGGMGGQAREHVAEIGEGVDAEVLAVAHQILIALFPKLTL